MEPRPDGPQTPFEVYCYDCRVSFAAGTRKCIHCGRKLGGPRMARAAEAPGAPGVETDDDLLDDASPLRRMGGISLWVLIALGAAITRMCEGA